MLYLFYGSDERAARSAMRACLASLQKKRPGAALVSFTTETFRSDQAEGSLVSQGLFERALIVLFDHVCSHSDAARFFTDHASQAARSANDCIVLEGSLSSPLRDILLPHAHLAKATDEKPRRAERPTTSLFSVADALGNRDKKRAWFSFIALRRNGVSEEQLHGILSWQVKILWLVKRAEEDGEKQVSASALGLNPYVFAKAVSFARNFTVEELVHISFALVALYHDARRGEIELGNGLELLLLRL